MNPTVTVIVPAYNASATLSLCLKALLEEPEREIIVVDDCSTDTTPEIARSMGVQLIQTAKRSGPAAARNLGAEKAAGEILFFVDADVVIHKNSISLVQNILQDEKLAAVFGSYDDEPAEENFLSQYKNLLHHFVHHNSNADASTFWAGCGAIRKDLFLSVSGFNAEIYPHPSIEDIELGVRLRKKNLLIRLDKRLQGKHLKKWNALSLLRADILYRAFPWSRLIADMGEVPNELNLHSSHRISAVLAALFFALLLIGVFFPSWSIVAEAVLLLALVIFLNRSLYAFFLRKKGLIFVTGAIFWHMFYYVYSGIVFVFCWTRYRLLHSGDRPSLHPLPAKINEKR
ncbi:glycosyltransferase [bacterium]|nr:glycosyltransferase [bacterium]MCI0606967.1 glycosyltransferase [bacterium]